jgi:phage shock protein A
MNEINTILANRSRDIHHLRDELLTEAAGLVWYNRQNFDERLRRLQEQIAENTRKIEELERQHPELTGREQRSRDYYNQLRSGQIPDTQDNEGRVPSDALADARMVWQNALARAQTLGNELSSLRNENRQLGEDVKTIEAVARPAAPTIAELAEILRNN